MLYLIVYLIILLSQQTVSWMGAETKFVCSWTFLPCPAKIKFHPNTWLAFNKQIDEWIFAFAFAISDACFKFWDQTRHPVLHFLKVRKRGAALQQSLTQAADWLTVGSLEGRLCGAFPGVLFIQLPFQVLTTNFPISHEFFQALQEPTIKSKGSSLYVPKCYLQKIFRVPESKFSGLKLCLVSSSLWRCYWAGAQESYFLPPPPQVRIEKRSVVFRSGRQ